MRKLTFENKSTRLSEKAINSLSERFNWRNAIFDRGWWRINKECILCTEFKNIYNCYLCPLAVFKKNLVAYDGTPGCFTLINSIIPDDTLEIGSQTISWPNSRNQEAREQLDLIRNALLDLPKTRRAK